MRNYCTSLGRISPRLPIETLDILYFDEMGKNISGGGMDSNIIGFWRREGGERKPSYDTLAVFSLTPESHGNAMGMGLADIIPQNMYDGIDFAATYRNGMTAGLWRSVRTPVVLPTVRDIVDISLSKIPDGRPPRVARARSTLMLEVFWASEPLVAELSCREDIVIEGKTTQWNFGADGELLPFVLS